MFQDHAVLQRGEPVRVWGLGPAGDTVTVSLKSQSAGTKVASDGRWSVTLPALEPGGSYELTARAGSGATRTAHDVLVGDVFLCSGQSNMEMPVLRAADSFGEINNEPRNNTIRWLNVRHATGTTPQSSFASAVSWKISSPDTVADWSAVCLFFARELQPTIHVPIGLIQSTWGGTKIRPWISTLTLHASGQHAAEIYNAMIAPLGSYTLRGALWYQGESNASEYPTYRGLLGGLMNDWRRQFGPDLPFLIVQLPNYGPFASAPGESDWAGLREAQRLAVNSDPHAGLVVTIDVGEPHNLHPTDKQDVAKRLVRAAHHVIYGDPAPPSGPIPVRATRHGRQVTVEFGAIEKRLVVYGHDQPIGFELCADQPGSCRFVQADLSGSHVELTVAAGTTPTRVRYLWADSPICTLYDESGIPAGPFELRLSNPDDRH